jgi:hypothetical protein
MNDVELAQLELRLRKSVVGHAPAAPEALVRFIDTVPAMEPERRRPNLAHARPGVRRAVFALAAAAAIVLAVAGTSALVTIRGSQTPGVPAAGDGWSWQQADGSLVDRVSQVARGFIGVCRGDTGTWSLCTSADGSTWAVPPDQSILTVEGSDQFWPWQVARSGGVYVAIGSAQMCPTSDGCSQPAPVPPVPVPPETSSGNLVWRSTDGVRWNRIGSPAFVGLGVAQVGEVAGSFVAIALGPSGEGWALTSADGLVWSRSSPFPAQPGMAMIGDLLGQPALWSPGSAGLCVGDGSATNPVEWRSLDVKTWTQVHLPSGLAFACGGRVADGSYLGLGPAASAKLAVGFKIVRSADGLTWRVDQGNLDGFVASMAYVGDRLVAGVSKTQLFEATTQVLPIWESAGSNGLGRGTRHFLWRRLRPAPRQARRQLLRRRLRRPPLPRQACAAFGRGGKRTGRWFAMRSRWPMDTSANAEAARPATGRHAPRPTAYAGRLLRTRSSRR